VRLGGSEDADRAEAADRLVVATYLPLPAALAASDLIATVPRRVAEQIAANAAIAITPLPIDFATTVSMAWHRRATADPAQSWFRSLLTDAAAIGATPGRSDPRN
jgi:DNA-binding transcriptional LysR family regulator